MLATIVIRTLNEAEYLADLLVMIGRQKTNGLDHEVVLVDSGSTDGTIETARRHGCRITTIDKRDFSFGRSLNRGCEMAKGDILVFISGHCIPVDEHWLQTLCQPVFDGVVSYAYGRQIGDDDSHFSECRIFAKHYPKANLIPQEGFFCNNANAALLKTAWAARRFNEDLTGLEDMELAKWLLANDHRLGYVAQAPVFHHHRETWSLVRVRFEREAIALQQIMPEVHLSRFDVVRYILLSVFLDWKSALRHGKLLANWKSILRYRISQYIGSYAGSNNQRHLSKSRKEKFFYPAVDESDDENESLKPHRRTPPHEGEQPADKG